MPGSCAVAALELYGQVMRSCGWKEILGFLFPDMKATGNMKQARGHPTTTPRAITASLQKYAQLAVGR